MKVYTLTCEDCGTITAGNVVERYRRMKCPRVGCENVVEFGELSPEQREHMIEHIERYRID